MPGSRRGVQRLMHNCPKDGCGEKVPRSQYACRVHWYSLPRPLRDEIWATYTARMHREHAEAMAAGAKILNPASP